jgi:hypothetical protein
MWEVTISFFYSRTSAEATRKPAFTADIRAKAGWLLRLC